ncbi:PAS domain S-box protein [Paucibacter sp. TC2R-5]|uniref:PAS domain S-box protein n=1 Tax=Paucibacter sp. TC2R-5 TaxID=2893555 RepID=UPI0021E497B9|nr:PAS domain S-box protein [Paucibacter sp. TC2R-5]MCV2359224.1 PAS domain S-box protein [Paucibacter sp. TC2R-5]
MPRDLAALRGLFGLISDPLMLLSESLDLLEANASALAVLEQPPGQTSGKGLHGLQTSHGGRLGDWLRLASRAISEGRRGPPAPSIKLPNGQRAPLSLVALPPQDETDPARWLLHARVEDKPRTKSSPAVSPSTQALQQACSDEVSSREHAELAQWFKLCPLPMVLFDAQGLLLKNNAAFAALCLRLPATLHEADPAIQQLLAWQSGRLADELLALREPEATLHTQANLHSPNGRTHWLQGRVQAFNGGQGGLPQRYLAVLEDRSVEQERDLAHQQLDALMDTAGVGLATFAQDAGWLRPRASRTPAGAPGAARNPMASLQGISRDIVESASLPEFERLQKALKKGDRIEVRYAVRHPELGRRWLLTRVEPGQLKSGQRTTSVVTLDVTAQAQAEDRSEQLLHELTTIMDSASLGLAYLRGDQLLRCNRGFEQMLGLNDPQTVGTAVSQLFAALPELATQVQAALPNLLEQQTFEAEFLQVGSEEKQPRWLSLSLRRVTRPGEAPELDEVKESIAVISDISRLKAQQAELEALVQDREMMFSLSDVGIAILRNGRVTRANDALAQLTGYRIHELSGLDHQELFDSTLDFDNQNDAVESALNTYGLWRGERRVRRQDGTGLWMQVSKRVMRPGAPDEGLIATYVNVDDRWRAQQSLMLQTERERAVLDSVLVGIVTVGRGGIEWMNRSARRMFGGDLSEFAGQPMSVVATPASDHPFRQSHYLDELTEGQTEAFECRLKACDGREFWVVGNAVVTGARATGRQLTYALLDIDRRRQAEAQTQQAQASLSRIIEAAPLAISLHDAKTLRVEQINQAAAALAGRSEAELMGASPEDLFGREQGELIRRDMLAALQASAVTQHEYRLGSGEQMRVWDARFLHLAGTSEGSESAEIGAPEQLLLVASDVTEHRAAEEARLQAAISQRELLVREVHHRIKNNLQGVAGLLQQIAARRPEVASVINEAVGQVHAIAQVYGLQVGGSGPLRIRRVMDAIIGSVQRMSGRSIATHIEGVSAAQANQWALPEAESIPVALTLNELLTNAIKHSQDSVVSCTLICGVNSVAVEIINTGRLPTDFSLAQVPGGVSGLGLVRALLPRRSALLTLDQREEFVVCRMELLAPSVSLLSEP